MVWSVQLLFTKVASALRASQVLSFPAGTVKQLQPRQATVANLRVMVAETGTVDLPQQTRTDVVPAWIRAWKHV